MLGEIADGQMFATGALTTEQGSGAAKGIHKGGLTGPVRPQQTNPGAGQQGDIDVLQNGHIPMARDPVANGQQWIGDLVRDRELETEG